MPRRLTIAKILLPVLGFGFALHAGAAPRDRNVIAGIRPFTLSQALALAYANNPTLQQQRAALRETDETVPAALAGWRPTVTITGSAGRIDGTEEYGSTGLGTVAAIPVSSASSARSVTRNEAIGQLTVTQPVFQGGKTVADTHEAKDNVYAARAALIATEQTVLLNVVTAYVAVIEDRQLLALDVNNQKVLAEQLRATRDQYHVGNVTQTSVAQAVASEAQAEAQVQVANGNARNAEQTFLQYVGAFPGARLATPQPLALPVASQKAAVREAMMNNPNVISNLFTEAADKDAVDVAFASLAPQISLQASGYDESNPVGAHTRESGAQLLADLTVPLYQGGSEYAAIRQARDKVQDAYAGVIGARRAAVAQAVQAWESLLASEAAVRSTRTAVHSDAIALDGTEREELVGTRDTLDVLNAQQALLNAETQVIQNVASVVTNSYTIVAAIGRLTAADLGLPVPHYDDLKYYHAVKNALFGTGNGAYQAAGIAPDGTLLAEPAAVTGR